MTAQAPCGATDVLVVGGGIAGLAAAYHLTHIGGLRVRVLEREPLLASHSSGRNAAMFRHLENARAPCWLAARSRALLDDLTGSRSAWLRCTGGLFVAAHRDALAAMARNAQENEINPTWLEGAALRDAVPALDGTEVRVGLYVSDDGIIDIHHVTDTLARAARRCGARIDTGVEVRRVLVEGGRVRGVQLDDGQVIPAHRVVIAGGAWSAGLGESCGAPLSLTPKRRHLVQLELQEGVAPDVRPIVWRVDEGEEEIYFRPESGGVLASPCDERIWQACLPPCDEDALVLLADKLGRLASRLALAHVRRYWACLRTFAEDRASVVGADPRRDGLFWLAGLGGHGMTTATAEGELLAAAVLGRPHPLADVLSPTRLLAPQSCSCMASACS